MKRNAVSRETGFPARWQLTENRKESILALAGRLSLCHDVYDGKAVECERGVSRRRDGLECSSLSRGYRLVIIGGVLECIGNPYSRGMRSVSKTGAAQDGL